MAQEQVEHFILHCQVDKATVALSVDLAIFALHLSGISAEHEKSGDKIT